MGVSCSPGPQWPAGAESDALERRSKQEMAPSVERESICASPSPCIARDNARSHSLSLTLLTISSTASLAGPTRCRFAHSPSSSPRSSFALRWVESWLRWRRRVCNEPFAFGMSTISKQGSSACCRDWTRRKRSRASSKGASTATGREQRSWHSTECSRELREPARAHGTARCNTGRSARAGRGCERRRPSRQSARSSSQSKLQRIEHFGCGPNLNPDPSPRPNHIADPELWAWPSRLSWAFTHEIDNRPPSNHTA